MAYHEMKIFTKEELRKYDGSKHIAYIACYGKVSDMSDSYHCRNGVRQVTRDVLD